MATEIEYDTIREITSELDKMFIGTSNAPDWPSNRRFAVRSSAIGEDSADLSSAGQNETFLGCHGTKQILDSIKNCWASNFTFQSTEYRRYQ